MCLLACAFAAFTITSCNQDLESPQPTDGRHAHLRIEPTISGRIDTRAEKNAWARGDVLGIFICTQDDKIDSPYLGKDSYSNVEYTYSGSLWDATRETNLGVDAGNVYAYYPYVSDADPTAIPVKVEGQTDYLYGKADTLVNYQQKVATIRMKHAMTQFSLQLTLGEYEGDGYVSSIKIRNSASAGHLVSSGTLNIQSGKIQGGEPTDLTVWTADSVSVKGNKLTVSQILVPTGSTQNEGDIRLEVTIDGKVFYYDFKAGTDWKAGYRNIYRSSINSNALVIDPENGIIIEPWKDNSENAQVELIPVS